MDNNVTSNGNPTNVSVQIDPVEEMGINIADALILAHRVNPHDRGFITTFCPAPVMRSNRAAIRAWVIRKIKKEGAKAGDDAKVWEDALESKFVQKLQKLRERTYH